MRTIFTLVFILIGPYGFSQDLGSRLIGTFEKKYVGTYTRVVIKADTTFDYYKSCDIMSYQLNGRYEIKGDTLILNSENDFITAYNEHFSMENEKWIIINDNIIYTGSDYNPKIVYVGGFLERKNE